MEPRQSTSSSTASSERREGGAKPAADYQRLDSLPPAVNRWSTNEEVATMLRNALDHPEWTRTDTLPLPPSGSLLLYNRDATASYKQVGLVLVPATVTPPNLTPGVPGPERWNRVLGASVGASRGKAEGTLESTKRHEH